MTLTESTRGSLERYYRKAAEDYFASLPEEHSVESPDQSTQREITLASLALVKAKRPDVHVFSELLIQYPKPRRRRPGQVVPDNFVVIYDGVIDPDLSYNTPFVKPAPFWVLEYVSKSNPYNDYGDKMRQYERGLKVPYYLLFDPRKQKLTLYHHDGKRYIPLKANEAGRLELPELDLEMAIVDRFVRFWYQGKLLPLPADTQAELEAATQKNEELEREVSRLRKEVERLKTRKNGNS